MRKAGRRVLIGTAALLTVSLLLSLFVGATDGSYAERIRAQLGKPNENDAIALCLEAAQEGDELVLTLSFSILREDAKAIYGLQADLYFDEERLECATETDEDGVLRCAKQTPDGWSEADNLTKTDPKRAGLIRISVFTTDISNPPASAEQPLVLEFRFRWVGDAHEAGVWLPHRSVKTYDRSVLHGDTGTGAFLVAAREEFRTPGDVNGDGKVNSKDLTRLIKHLSGEAVDVTDGALDLNGDGKVNMKDYTRLLKYLSGEEVELH